EGHVLLKGQEVLPGKPGVVLLGHAIATAQVAPICDG
ncbi:MAG: hypothetical protein ACJAZN_003178, partial [Planctomycetota bacterium]